MHLCIFEDQFTGRLEPLIYSRPVYDLVCGINTLKHKILRAYSNVKYSLHVREVLAPFVKIKYPDIAVNQLEDDDYLFVNGRVIADENLSKIIPLEDSSNKLYMNDNNIIAVRLSGDKLKRFKPLINSVFIPEFFYDLKIVTVEVPTVNYLWDLINQNGAQMRSDYNYHMKSVSSMHNGNIYDGAMLVEKENIYIGEGATVKPGAVIDASLGPVYLDSNCLVKSNAVIEGPVYVGRNSIVKSCAMIYENVSIGEVCKVGGEVEDSIIVSYTNKQHSGFLGHAYLGSWVNIGADTNNSDLKNNYGNVRMYVDGEVVDSGTQFLGLIMGDHSKTSINSMFNTGTVVGFSCNIFGSGFPPKYLPSFSWGGAGSLTTYDLGRSIETARRVLLRRKKIMTEAEINLFKKVFELTQDERRKRGYPY